MSSSRLPRQCCFSSRDLIISKISISFKVLCQCYILLKSKSEGKIGKRLSSPVIGRKPHGRASLHSLSKNKSQWKKTKKDLGVHKLVFEEGGLLDGTELAYYSGGQVL